MSAAHGDYRSAFSEYLLNTGVLADLVPPMADDLAHYAARVNERTITVLNDALAATRSVAERRRERLDRAESEVERLSAALAEMSGSYPTRTPHDHESED